MSRQPDFPAFIGSDRSGTTGVGCGSSIARRLRLCGDFCSIAPSRAHFEANQKRTLTHIFRRFGRFAQAQAFSGHADAGLFGM